MSATFPAFLQRADSKEIVSAVLHERIDQRFAKNAEEQWRAYLAGLQGEAEGKGLPYTAPGHTRWQWEKKVAESEHLLSCPTLAIECENAVQGLMLLQTDGHFAKGEKDDGKPLVYVCYLTTAPWNLDEVQKQPKFEGVGSMLIRAAIEISIDLEFKGRIGLHSLPAAESFYECIGFQRYAADPDKEDLPYFELSSEKASALMNRRKS